MEIIDCARSWSGQQSSFQEPFREIGRAEPKCNRSGQYDSSPGNAESHDDDVSSNAELLQCHGPCEDLDAPSRAGCDESSWGQSGVDGGNQDSLGYKV